MSSSSLDELPRCQANFILYTAIHFLRIFIWLLYQLIYRQYFAWDGNFSLSFFLSLYLYHRAQCQSSQKPFIYPNETEFHKVWAANGEILPGIGHYWYIRWTKGTSNNIKTSHVSWNSIIYFTLFDSCRDREWSFTDKSATFCTLMTLFNKNAARTNCTLLNSNYCSNVTYCTMISFVYCIVGNKLGIEREIVTTPSTNCLQAKY